VMDHIPKREIWTTNLPEYPKFWEILIMLLVVAFLLAAGNVIKRRWTQNNDSLPLPVALMLWLGMFAVYFAVATAFFNLSPASHRTTVIVMCFAFWVIPVAYYTHTVINSLAMRTLDHIGPFSARIDDPSEFAAARKLALRGDIDGAISMYRNYPDNQVNALFEAARLLKSEDRYLEAALMLEEISQRFSGQTRVWAEATYQLARLKETNLNDRKQAVAILKNIMERAPESRFSQLAAIDLARLKIVDKEYLKELTEDEKQHEQDPFFDSTDVRVSTRVLPKITIEPSKDEDGVPVQDPFFALHKNQEAAAKALAEAPDDMAVVVTRPARKAAAKKPAVKKPSVKKPAAKKTAAKKPVAKKRGAK